MKSRLYYIDIIAYHRIDAILIERKNDGLHQVLSFLDPTENIVIYYSPALLSIQIFRYTWVISELCLTEIVVF